MKQIPYQVQLPGSAKGSEELSVATKFADVVCSRPQEELRREDRQTDSLAARA